MELRKSVRPEVLDFKPYTPGLSIDEIRDRYGLNQVIKMASNENPLGTSPVVQEVLARKAGSAFRYAQAGNPALRAALGRFLSVDPEMIVAGNGSDEIIDLLIRIKARPGVDNIVAFCPCFSIYALQAGLCGVELRQAPLGEDMRPDWDGLLALVDEHTALVFVTSPDNPSGYAAPVQELRALQKQLPEQALLVVDEAYIEFADPVENHTVLPLLKNGADLVVLRTFSKMFGLAGLRLGYGIMPAWLADLMLRVRLPFSVNILAEEAGMAVLRDKEFQERTLQVTRQGRTELTRGLEQCNCRVLSSQANFLMFQPPCPADDLFQALLEQGIIIRPLKSYDRPDWLRVSVGNERENRQFLEAVQEVLRGK
ncbi:MAG TPA: histidinol-phosphate transaminase [Desulfomicrobiaceae bacterium]|nr:histidinol-phosphate transaminase [Desulfomicrobiaceae bacterium]